MIAKRITREKGTSDFERLGAYVLNARGGVDPASWSRLGAYVLDEAHQGEKVAWARVTNCQSDDPGWAVKEIQATQARNMGSQSDKSYHLVVSFPEGERPTREQLADIEDRLCAALGFAEHHAFRPCIRTPTTGTCTLLSTRCTRGHFGISSRLGTISDCRKPAPSSK